MKVLQPQIDILDKGLEVMPNNIKLQFQKGKVYYQWDENNAQKQFYSNNIKKAEKIFEHCAATRPGNDEVYYFLGKINLKYKKDYKKSVDCFRKFMQINPHKYHEAINLISSSWREHAKRN